MLFIVIFTTANLNLIASDTNELKCTKFESEDWGLVIGKLQKTCFVENARIDATGFKITSSPDETIDCISMKANKRIEFFPENIAEKFPNLIGLNAKSCSLETLSKDNFKNFHKLRSMTISYNFIEKISTDTFMDLKLLEILDLSKVLLGSV